MKLVALALVSSLSIPAHAEEPKCQREFVLRMGKLFAPEVYEDANFDVDTSPASPFCAGDVLPYPDLLKYIEDTRALRLLRKEFQSYQDSAANDLKACQDESNEVTLKWVECESKQCPVPPVNEVEVEPPWYQGPIFWSIVVAVVAGTGGYLIGQAAN